MPVTIASIGGIATTPVAPAAVVEEAMARIRPADIARKSAKAFAQRGGARGDAFRRETFALPREEVRAKARELFRRFPKAAYQTEIETWRVLPGDRIEFTMRRLPSAD